MIFTPLKFATQCGLGTKVPEPMANLVGHEGPVVLLERKDSPAKLAGQSTDR
jgi:hypothetical protein